MNEHIAPNFASDSNVDTMMKTQPYTKVHVRVRVALLGAKCMGGAKNLRPSCAREIWTKTEIIYQQGNRTRDHKAHYKAHI